MIGVSVHVRRAAKVPVPVILLRLSRDCPHGLGDGEHLTGRLHPSLEGIHARRTIHVGEADAGV